MRGGQGIVNSEDLAKFPDLIESLGFELASRHQTKTRIIQEENKLTKTHIHDRDYKWAIKSDAGVFEISNPSLGVGGEISDMAHLGKPILCLFKKGLEENVSAYILGKMGSQYVKPPFECYAYQSVDDAKEKIRQFIETNV